MQHQALQELAWFSWSCREQTGGAGNSGERKEAAWSDLTIMHDMQIAIIVVLKFDHDCNWSSLRLLLTLIETSIEVDWGVNWSWLSPQLKLIQSLDSQWNFFFVVFFQVFLIFHIIFILNSIKSINVIHIIFCSYDFNYSHSHGHGHMTQHLV